MSKLFSFTEQNAVGKKGEALLKKRWPMPLKKLEGKGPDFIDIDGNLIELKTDTYGMDKSPNFFIERWSVMPQDNRPGKPGGPWQSIAKGSTIWIYLFITDKTWFIFRDIPKLIARLEELTSGKGLVYIKNAGWTTAGYKVPREDLADLYTEEKL